MSNDSQSVVQTTTYDAFGNIESSAGSSSNAYKYAGQWGYRNDGDDGLMHVGARDYDPLVGRFISADTYLGDIGNPQSLNLYVYVENDPINMVDPTGHDANVLDMRTFIILGGGSAGLDGILPIGDAIGVGIIIGGGLYILWERLMSEGGKQRIRDTGLQDYSDAEIRQGAREGVNPRTGAPLPPKERKRWQRERKAREKPKK